MFPFHFSSLTKAVEENIHKLVREAAPTKYWAFRISDVVGKLGMYLMLATIVLSVVAFLIFGRHFDPSSAEHKQATMLMAQFMIATGVPAVVGSIVRETLHKELQPIVRRAAHSIGMP